MLATFRNFNACIRRKYMNWNVLMRSSSNNSHLVNVLYVPGHNQLFAQVYPLTIIPFQQLPFALFKPFHNSTTSRLGNGDSPQNETPVGIMENAAYRLLYVKLDRDDMLKLSALWMQVMEGPCKEPKPTGSEDLAYWQSWMDLGNMSKEEALQQYLEIAQKYT